jgi:aryl-phospho-beta-D-glucosidase BglC (GH1 family)
VKKIESIVDHGFRVPFSVQALLEYKKGIESENPHVNHSYNKELDGMNGLDIMDYFMQQARQNGLKIFLNIHCIETDQMVHMYPLWYDSTYSINQFYEAIEWIIDRYKDDDVLIRFDLKNEPHRKATETQRAIWNDGTWQNNWKAVAVPAAINHHDNPLTGVRRRAASGVDNPQGTKARRLPLRAEQQPGECLGRL